MLTVNALASSYCPGYGLALKSLFSFPAKQRASQVADEALSNQSQTVSIDDKLPCENIIAQYAGNNGVYNMKALVCGPKDLYGEPS